MPSGRRAEPDWRRKWETKAAAAGAGGAGGGGGGGGGSDAPLLLLLEPTSQKLTEIWRKNFKQLSNEVERVFSECTQMCAETLIEEVTRINMSLWRWKTTGQGMFVEINTTRLSDIGLRVRACRTRSRKGGWLERTRGWKIWRRASSTSSRSHCGSSGRELSGRRRLSTGWGRSLEGRRTCKEPSGWSHCPAAPLRIPTTVKVSIVITIGRWRLFLIEFFLKSFFSIYQRENGEVTCILSMSSELSQKIVDSFTFLISFNCNHNRLSGKVSFWKYWNIFLWFGTCSMVKEDGQPEPSYQYLSPNLTERCQNIYSSTTKYLQLSQKYNCCIEPEVVKLFADDTGEGGSDHGARQR